LITDDNILGPFYKADAPFKSDLTDGQVGTGLIVSGTVYCSDCVTPLANAIVDVWQANDSGAYDSVGFVLRGRMETNAEGKYEYASILPGFYLNGAQYRPRHIHYKVSHPQGTALTTQLYFEGDPYIPIDPFVKPGLIKPLVQDGAIYRCNFDVVLG
jgi:catechol 1,2-dioxygenase